MNQLQTFMQESLLSTGHVEQCAIIRKKDLSLRAASPGLSLTKAELLKVCEAHQNPITTRESGLNILGCHYKCVRSDKYAIYAKLDGRGGIVLITTATLIIMALYNQNMYPAVCVEAAETLADYLRQKGK